MKLFTAVNDADEIVLSEGGRGYVVEVGFPEEDLLRLTTTSEDDYHFRDQDIALDESGCVEVTAFGHDGDEIGPVTLQFLVLVAYQGN